MTPRHDPTDNTPRPAGSLPGHIARRARPNPHAVSPWLSSSGEVSHPDAPTGGGGAGFFRHDGPADTGDTSLHDPAHPHSPTGRGDLLSDADRTIVRLSDEEDKSDAAADEDEAAPNPPPRVTADTEIAVKHTAPTGLKVQVTTVCKILRDKEVPGLDGPAKTEFSGKHVKFDFPDFKKDPDDPSLLGEQTKDFKLHGHFSIETKYQRSEYAAEPSGYGRGTTKQDIDDRNTTLGFHESCHRADYINWINTQDVPILGIAVGDSWEQFAEAKQKFPGEIGTYVKQALADSDGKTDDVGKPTKDEFMKELEEEGGE